MFDEIKKIGITSSKNVVHTKFENSLTPLDSAKRKEIVHQIIEEANDSANAFTKNR